MGKLEITNKLRFHNSQVWVAVYGFFSGGKTKIRKKSKYSISTYKNSYTFLPFKIVFEMTITREQNESHKSLHVNFGNP